MNSPDFDPDDLHHDGTPPGSGQGQSRKRKAPGASGRGVASLTPEQLAKKRANDREAQRAIRERTKNMIETLEGRIRDLTSQQPYQELQAAIREKEAVQAENEEIRRRLASVVSILQPLLGAQGLLNDHGNANSNNTSNNNSIHPSLSRSDAIAELAQAAQHNVQSALAQPNNVNLFQPDRYMNGGHSRAGPSQAGDQNNYPSPFPSSEQEPTPDAQSWQTQRAALSNQRETMQRSHELSENGERLNFSFLIDSTLPGKTHFVPSVPGRRDSPHDRSSSSYPSFSDGQTQGQNQSQRETHSWRMLPKNCPPTCPLDHILLNFLQARQRETASYASGSSQTPTYTSPAYPSISNLLNPTNTTTSTGTSSPTLTRHIQPTSSSAHKPSDPLSTLMTDIIAKFPNISGLPEQVATAFFMFITMRWQIYPTQENYERLPDWLAPRPSQLFTPHPAWMDHLPWPRMRDRLVHNHDAYPFEHWFLPFTSGLSVNWPYEPVDCLISTGDQEAPTLNPVFERHIYRLENWTVGPQFKVAFPALADTVNIKDRGSSNFSIPLDGDQMPQGLASIGAGMGLPMHEGGQVSQVRQEQVAGGSDSGG
ncbi:hypothetical protein OHC33_007052 [Knufia fluminis]|uniref:BZIP transcription factor n=1 Tax=Knufia fluminis TaxID=191047 RepID=A0AAN8EDP5_9EURO|nr:hypothetical protein OHC33_007052 [Knufia fluminis]